MAKPPKGYRFYLRKWLNPAGRHSTAFLYATIGARSRYAELKIADCDRQISLSIDADKHGLKKLDTLIAGLVAFRAALEAASKEKRDND